MMDFRGHHEQELKREKDKVKRKLFYALLLLATIYIIAIELFHYVEGWDWLDSIYFTTSTITTVGYGDITPQTQLGRMITIPLMLVGIAVGLYAIYAIQDYGKHSLSEMGGIVDGQVESVGRERRRLSDTAKEHFEKHVMGRIKRG
jgi:hypothetical protein